MALETATYIDGLVLTNPAATDGLAQADDHMRLIKSTILATFPNVTNVINSTHTELNIVDGNTAATSTTLVDADRFVVNDDGTMVQVAMSDLATYMDTKITTINGLTYPIADGNSGEFMTTDGAGTLSFAPVVSFLSGMIIPYAGTSAPTGWLFCYGQAINRTSYAALFAALGTTYGPGDGSTTFNLPGLRGRTIAGKDNMGGTSADRLTDQSGGLNGDVLGDTGGAETHQLTVAELAAHAHNSRVPVDRVQEGYDNGVSWGGDHDSSSGNSHSPQTRQLVGNTGGDTPHNNVQPTIILNYIIKT